MSRILLVEDDENLAAGIEYNLQRVGHEVVRAADGEEALAALRAARRDGAIDLTILDLMLPRKSGFDVLQEMAAAGLDVPVLILSARDEEVDKVRGFDLGAVDYVTKPFSLAELLARVKTRLRERGVDDVVRLGDREVDLPRYRVVGKEGALALTRTEVALLKQLLARRGELVPREDLLRGIWNLGPRSTRSLDTHVARLRKKLEDDPAAPRFLRTVFGIGYRLLVDGEERA